MRTTEDEVKAIIDTELTGDEITPFLRSANVFVTASLGSTVLSVDHLREIEAWVAAHFVAVRDPRLTSRKAGEATDTYQKAGEGKRLEATIYGQQALVLDTTGTLAGLQSAQRTARIEVLG